MNTSLHQQALDDFCNTAEEDSNVVSNRDTHFRVGGIYRRFHHDEEVDTLKKEGVYHHLVELGLVEWSHTIPSYLKRQKLNRDFSTSERKFGWLVYTKQGIDYYNLLGKL